ncbi:HesA/MoeB/ThiF family protein [Cellulomonas sp. NTE-D12]|uniref:HesA/MoeB/ThiF family protein n=1 Tax=Cellulomonas sp. NTE-D12 TaxID=2962632 RepID=UPI003081B1A8|nr:adenylyltransferase/sulfurtransferase MoeZ [Cellulomonas sp. NTE-D12]
MLTPQPVALPPLVAPGPPLAESEARRTARQTLLPELGELGQRRLAAARVLVIGAGGLGAPALLYLAAAGVGTIGIVDDDVVALTDLHRQVIHATAAVGEPKVDSAARRLTELAPDLVVEPHRLWLDESNAATVLQGYDLVLDGTDTFATRYLISDTCAELGVPLVWASVLRFDAQVSVFWSRPPAGIAPVTLRDLFPEPPAPGSVPSCAEAGVLGALCGMVGSMMATEAVKLVIGAGQVLLGRVAVVDALGMRVREVPLLPRATSAPTDVAGAPGAAAGASPAVVTERLAVGTHPVPFTARATGDPRGPATAREATASGDLSLDEYRALAAADPAPVLLDVREPSEFAADALPGAVNVPVSALVQASRHGPDVVRALLTEAGADPTGLLVAYCAVGARSTRAVQLLVATDHRARTLAPAAVTAIRAEVAAAGRSAR